MTTVFHVSVYALTALAALILSFAEEFPLPTGLTLPIAMAAFYWNERRRTIRLRVITANLLGLLAFCVAGVELSGVSLESRVLAGAHLLTYLSWIAMFQAKTGRQYWWLLALSVMQVAVASILTERGIFGVLLVLYVFCGMWTLAVYSVYQAYHKFERAGRIRDKSRTPNNVVGADKDGAQQGHGNVNVDVEQGKRRERSSRKSRVTKRRPIHRQRSEYRGAIQLDPDQRWINGRFVVGVVTTSVLSLVVGAIFFAMVPRMWVGRRTVLGQDTPPIQSMTGFTDEVQLGSMGKIWESNRPVLQAWFFNAQKHTPISIEDVCKLHGFQDQDGFATEPLFRGSVMGRYEKGRWFVLKESQLVAKLQPPQVRSHDNYVRQEYVLEQTGTKTLFGIHPIFWAEKDEKNRTKVAMDIVTSILMRDDDQATPTDNFEYTVFSYTPKQQRPARIGYHPSRQSLNKRLQAQKQFAEIPAGFEKLTALAKQIESQVAVDDLRLTPADRRKHESIQARLKANHEATRRLRIAKAVESFLGDSPDYSYSLEASIMDDKIDPVEDFLINRKAGHCEYYASAMALILRSLGIETRLISGFKGGEKSLSGAFVVAERHAHAWVEVLIHDQWRTFDPTPASRSDVVREIGEEQSVFSALSDFATGLWHQRVIRLSEQEQRRSIYEPLGKWVKAKLTQLGPTGEAIAQHLSKPSGWFSWQTFVAVFVLVLGGLGIRKIWARILPNGLVRWLRDWAGNLMQTWKQRSSRPKIDFYDRFLRILAKQGMTRKASQTQLEFAQAAQAALQEALLQSDLSELPNQITRQFYQVRHGNQPLTSSEQETLNTRLSQLEDALTR